MSDAGASLRPARDEDLDAVSRLVNASYRGEGGWTNEMEFMGGPRTSADQLRLDLSEHPEAALLVFEANAAAPGEAIVGVVRVEPLGDDVWEIGMLAISPGLQDQKLGRRVLDAAEAVAFQGGGRCIEITVLNIRAPLIAWYRRRGYRETGEIRSFPYRLSPFGAPTREDLAFVVMRKDGVRMSAR